MALLYTFALPLAAPAQAENTDAQSEDLKSKDSVEETKEEAEAESDESEAKSNQPAEVDVKTAEKELSDFEAESAAKEEAAEKGTETEEDKTAEKGSEKTDEAAKAPPKDPKRPLEKKAVEAYNRGVDLHKKGHLNKAIEAYREAIQEDDRLEQAFSNLGMLYAAQNNWDKALDAFEKALNLKPDRTQSLNGIGTVLFQLK
ncbi:MAG: tetratricopeptide repeat protein, partial [Cyanobacteria bacterium HKST-UBA02]|nr:tetratricopeptide repeat protein [Cyanobacteria bacterium HKST-UBA02]